MRSNGRLPEKEFALIQEIAKRPDHTQRSLSQSVGLSLGTTNILIGRLARKGLIKVRQLDWKRTKYLLTLKGAMEKTQKAYHYTIYTVRLFRQIQDNIAMALQREYEAGRRDFTVVAQDELLELIKDSVERLGFADVTVRYLASFAEVPPGVDLVLAATMEPAPRKAGWRAVNLVDFTNIEFRLAP